MPASAVRAIAGCALCVLLSGCEALALTAFGVGASAGVQHTLSGVTYRTFTAPAPKVKTALLGSLHHMSIKVDSTEGTAGGELIRASTADRQIEIDIEKISPNTTRLRVVAKQEGLLYDSATATEIILQTEKLMGNT